MSCSFGVDEECCDHHLQPGWVGEEEVPVGLVGEVVHLHQGKDERGKRQRRAVWS